MSSYEPQSQGSKIEISLSNMWKPAEKTNPGKITLEFSALAMVIKMFSTINSSKHLTRLVLFAKEL